MRISKIHFNAVDAGKASQSNKHGMGENRQATQLNNMIKIAIILGSTRPGRNGEAVAKWVHQVAKKRSDAEFELVDVKDFNLPLLDEPLSPMMGNTVNLTPEYGRLRSPRLTPTSS